MIIQHNISAMNANRQLNITGGALTKSTRNLSSGYKINVAADDAAGLSISEKMRRQIRGLTQGVQNTEDGVSLCQVADGALSEVQDMLQRINELAVKAANGTNSESDRKCINDEVTQLLTEIDRIGDTTKFNEVFIFKGTDKLEREKMVTMGGAVSKPQIIPTPPFKDMSMDCELTEGPFNANSSGYQLDLAAKSTKPGAEGRWPLLFGSNAQPKLVVTSVSVGNVAIDIGSLPSTNYTARNVIDNEGRAAKEWKRTFQYNRNGINIEITQSVTLHQKSQDGSSQYYTVNYEVKNNSGSEIKYNLVHFEDTAYSNRDGVETYHLSGGNPVTNATMFTANGDFSTSINSNYVTSTVPNSFSIVDMQEALSFTENIVLDAGSGKHADTLIIGRWPSVRYPDEYTTATLSGILGTPLYRGTDHCFSLIWSDETLSAGGTESYSFKQGIVNVDADDNIDHDAVIKTPTTDVSPAPPKPVLIKTDYLGGNHQHWIQAGGEALDGMVLKINSMNTGVLDIEDISTLAEWTAEDAIDRVSIALAEISKQRSLIGAYQNRLEHTIANEDNIVENTTAAESQIRDTDMAKEMVQYSNKNILLQAGQSMLSQANQSKQGILSLLAA